MSSTKFNAKHRIFSDIDLHRPLCTDVVRRTSAVCSEVSRTEAQAGRRGEMVPGSRHTLMAEESSDRVSEMGYHQIDVGGGGDCFYRGISFLTYGTETRFLDVRREMAAYLRRHVQRYREFLVNLEAMASAIETPGRPTEGNIEARLAADTFGRQLTVFASAEEYDIDVFPTTYRECTTRGIDENEHGVYDFTLRPERFFAGQDPWPEQTLSDSSRMTLVFLPSSSGYGEEAGIGHYRVGSISYIGCNMALVQSPLQLAAL